MPRSCRALVSLLALFAALPLSAQRGEPARRGVVLGFDPLVYASMSSDAITGGRDVAGTGLALRFGWGFSEYWSLVMDVAVTDLEVADTAAYLLTHGDVMLRLTPVAWETRVGYLLPVLQAGWSLRDVSAEGESPTGTGIYTFEGNALTLGLGAELYLTRSIAIWLGAYWTSGEFDDERVGNITTHNRNAPATSVRFGTGLTLHGWPGWK